MSDTDTGHVLWLLGLLDRDGWDIHSLADEMDKQRADDFMVTGDPCPVCHAVEMPYEGCDGTPEGSRSDCPLRDQVETAARLDAYKAGYGAAMLKVQERDRALRARIEALPRTWRPGMDALDDDDRTVWRYHVLEALDAAAVVR